MEQTAAPGFQRQAYGDGHGLTRASRYVRAMSNS
jgi:hypothetical protein